MSTEAAIAREFELIMTKYGSWSLEAADATALIGSSSGSNIEVLRRLESIRETGRSWRVGIRRDSALAAPPFGSQASEF